MPFPISIEGAIPLPADESSATAACEQAVATLEDQGAQATLIYPPNFRFTVPVFRGFRFGPDFLATIDRIDLRMDESAGVRSIRYRLSLVRLALISAVGIASMFVIAPRQGFHLPAWMLLAGWLWVVGGNYVITFARARKFFVAATVPPIEGASPRARELGAGAERAGSVAPDRPSAFAWSPLTVVGVIGLTLSVICHGLSYFGVAAQEYTGAVWGLHVGIFPLFIPMVLQLRQRSIPRLGLSDLVEPMPAWAKATTLLVLMYVGLNFFLAIQHLPQGSVPVTRDPHLVQVYTMRAFSGHWLFFYLVPTFYFGFVARVSGKDEASTPAAQSPDPVRDRSRTTGWPPINWP